MIYALQKACNHDNGIPVNVITENREVPRRVEDEIAAENREGNLDVLQLKHRFCQYYVTSGGYKAVRAALRGLAGRITESAIKSSAKEF